MTADHALRKELSCRIRDHLLGLGLIQPGPAVAVAVGAVRMVVRCTSCGTLNKASKARGSPTGSGRSERRGSCASRARHLGEEVSVWHAWFPMARHGFGTAFPPPSLAVAANMRARKNRVPLAQDFRRVVRPVGAA